MTIEDKIHGLLRYDLFFSVFWPLLTIGLLSRLRWRLDKVAKQLSALQKEIGEHRQDDQGHH